MAAIRNDLHLRYFKQDCQQWLDECVDYVAQLLRDLAAVAEQSRYEAADGFSPVSPGFGEGSGSGAYGDRTASVALASPQSDPVKTNANKMHDSIKVAVRALRTADSARAKAMPNGIVHIEAAASSVATCVNCHELALPRAKAGRCGTCYQFRRRNGKDRYIEPIAS